MNKKVNTILFILGATVLNILVTLLFIFILGFIYLRFIIGFLPGEAQAWPFVVIFIGSMVLSFIVYRQVMNILMKRVDMEKYFDSVFGRKKR